MVKIRTAKDAVERYVMSAPLASIRYEREVTKKKWEHPEQRSIEHAIKMLRSSGFDRAQAIALLKELRQRTVSIIRRLQREEW